MGECLFCKLQLDESLLLDSNAHAYAVLDVAPIRPGHALVIPRQHVEDFFDLGEDAQLAMLQLANALAAALRKECRPQRVGLLVAGFELPHAHLHVVPIQDSLDLTSRVVLEGAKVAAAAEELQEMRQRLKARLAAS